MIGSWLVGLGVLFALAGIVTATEGRRRGNTRGCLAVLLGAVAFWLLLASVVATVAGV